MTVTAADVKQLRDRTSVGMMACRKALEEANGDMDQAIELLRKRGEAKAEGDGEDFWKEDPSGAGIPPGGEGVLK